MGFFVCAKETYPTFAGQILNFIKYGETTFTHLQGVEFPPLEP